MVNDQVVGLIGIALQAPVGEPAIVEVPAELIAMEPRLSYLIPGPSHGTLFVPDCSDRAWIAHQSLPENRLRFSLLAVLYGWAHANDQQLIYRNNPPNLVLSVDHGHFFPNGPYWQIDHLQNAPPATLHPLIVAQCGLTASEQGLALRALTDVSRVAIIRAVSSPPDDWGCTGAERVALAVYFLKRQKELLALLPSPAPDT